MPLPTRDEIPAAERWDPSLVFESPEAWEAAADELADRIPAVAAYEGRATTDGETLLELLQSVEEIKVRRLGRLWLYATMTRVVDTTDETARDRHARYRELRERLDEAVSFLAPAVRRAGRDRIETFVETTPGLERYESYLDRLLVGSECVVPAAATEAVSALETAAGGGSRVARAIRENDLTHATITWNGEQVTVTDERRAELLHRGDRETRRAAYEAHRDALASHRHGRAAAFTERLRALDRLAEIRGYDSPLAMHLDGWATTQAGPFPRAAYETVIEGVTERPDPRSRLMAARSDAVGGQLRPWDRDLSVVSGDPPTVHYEEATDLILAALDPLGESYVDRARELLAERRVDVRPTRHKQDGRKAAMLAAAGERPFLELRHDGTLRALYLFVHELGHALHRSLASDAQPAVSEAVPKHVGELPAFCHEALLADHLADRWEGRRARHAEAAFLRKLPLVRAVIGARFVREVQNSVAATPLGPDELADRYRTAAAPFTGHLAGDVGWEWQLRDLSRRPFHAYPYAVGVVGALATVRSLRTGELGSETYRERLALGRSERPVNLFRPAVDLTDRTTVERGLDAYRDRVERLLTG